jgi:excisionase family DNA binding protein
LLAALERLRALALARLVAVTTNARPDRADADPLNELRHLTPLQVAELLNLKEAYIHELCRSSQMPAVKRGKYWMIPVAALREWLARPPRGIDPRRSGPLPLPSRLAVPTSGSGTHHLTPTTNESRLPPTRRRSALAPDAE